jgi:hypothetical protein
MNLGNLPDFWALLAREFQMLENLPSLAEARLLSARAFDESQPAGHRAYIEATRYLGVARDNHGALLALLEHHGATLWAPWSLLRPIFEASFFASWILDSDSGRDRRLRGLRCEVLDCYQQRAHRAAFKQLPEVRRQIEDAERQQEQGLAGRVPRRSSGTGRAIRSGTSEDQHHRGTAEVELCQGPG